MDGVLDWLRRAPWAYTLLVVGFSILAFVAFAYGGGPTLFVSTTTWGVAALVNMVLSFGLIIHRRNERIKLLAYASFIVFGFFRSLSYILVGLWAPLGVWIIVTGLLIESVRLGSENSNHRRQLADRRGDYEE